MKAELRDKVFENIQISQPERHLKRFKVVFAIILGLFSVCSVAVIIFQSLLMTMRNARLKKIIKEDAGFQAYFNGDLMLAGTSIYVQNIIFCSFTIISCLIGGSLVFVKEKEIDVKSHQYVVLEVRPNIKLTMEKRAARYKIATIGYFCFALVTALTLIVYGSNNSQLIDEIRKTYRHVLIHNYDFSPNKSDAIFTNYWNKFQSKHQCCGMYFYRDFQTAKNAVNEPALILPKSCCIHDYPSCSTDHLDKIRPACSLRFVNSKVVTKEYTRWLICIFFAECSLTLIVFIMLNLIWAEIKAMKIGQETKKNVTATDKLKEDLKLS
ncbi:hypothetical protein Ciccas_003124 [Cichlidogyrus casuarinus]|uniref:Tetraspanin n=1 Tax=Cichlidogyrus casuarinus TaxID=1844966 RepID=A0ABD2QFC4_9PLAT